MDEKLQNYLNTKIENFINPQNDKRFILDTESPQILSSSSTYVTASGNEVEREREMEMEMERERERESNVSDMLNNDRKKNNFSGEKNNKPFYFQSVAEASDNGHTLKGLSLWWVENVFPNFTLNNSNKNTKFKTKNQQSQINSSFKNKFPETNNFNSDSAPPTDLSDKFTFLSKESFISSDFFLIGLINNNGAGKRVDDYISHHVGQSVLSKLGGIQTQIARRLVSHIFIHIFLFFIQLFYLFFDRFIFDLCISFLSPLLFLLINLVN